MALATSSTGFSVIAVFPANQSRSSFATSNAIANPTGAGAGILHNSSKTDTKIGRPA